MSRNGLFASLLGLGLAFGVVACQPAAQPNANTTAVEPGATVFNVALNGGQFNPPVQTAGTGTARVVLSADKSKATGTVTFAGLSGPVVAAHIHKGSAGLSGDAVKTLDVTDSGATFTWAKGDAKEPLTDAFVQDLLNGNLYFNFHTAKNAGGEIRGQITK